MNKLKTLLLIGIFLLTLLSLNVYADTTQIYTPYVVYAEILNGSEFVAVDNASLTITMPNGTDLITSIPMTNIGIGKYSYNFTPDMLGIWILSVEYDLNGSIIGSVSDQLNVLQSYTGGSGSESFNASLTPNVCVNNSGGMSLLYLFVGLSIIMFIVGLIFQKGIITILSGISLILCSFFLFPCSLWFGIILTGFGLLIMFLGLFMQAL
jgi:hypothetical protein